LVLPDDVAGDAPAVAERDALFFGPGPDVRAPCRLDAVRRPLPLFSASPAGVFDVGGELSAESGGVAGVQVDLVVGAADPGLDRLIRRATLEIVLETTVILVAIVASMPVMGYLQGTDHLPEPRSSAPAAAPLVRRFGEPNGEGGFQPSSQQVADVSGW
jgi:hypothetical protein